MSDKHTDAQGNFKKFDLTKDVPVTYGNSTGRATEGQAQTSAVVEPSAAFLLLCKAVMACREVQADIITQNGGSDNCDDWSEIDEGVYAGAGYCMSKIDELRAAQLADSTAPGAPVPYLWINTRPDSTDRTDRELYENIKQVEQIATTEKFGHCDTPLYLAAPTAQQSPTAGGAVPEAAISAAMSEGNKHDVNSFISARIVAAYLAAAPLPQVQSEALDVLCDLARYWDKNHIDADEANEEMCSIEDRVRAITDQQPVTPSGALADNDGGVA